MLKYPVICWWSGGVTSAVACRKAIDLYGLRRCLFLFIDTTNEDEDTYRFKKDCERWYGKEILNLRNPKYKAIQEVWYKFNSLNVAHGAICSSELKRWVREDFQKHNKFHCQIFGFDVDEIKRVKAMTLNYPASKAVFPLPFYGLSKKDCLQIVQEAGIEVPRTYQLGFHNNNCFKTGCVQGGIGYWQKMEREFPEKFNKMAEVEHELTGFRGAPVTMLKDQSKAAKASGNILVFLKKHPDYPNLKCLADMAPQAVKPLFECNGFCGTNDLERNSTEEEINFD